MKIAFGFGTRPEIIKLALLMSECKKKFTTFSIFTGQHTSLFDDVKNLIDFPDYVIPIPDKRDLNLFASLLYKNIPIILERQKPDLVIVHGDTMSALCCAHIAFLMGIKIGHVEAGLRTNNVYSPFPEEYNRQCIDKISNYLWCPTMNAVENLLNEKVQGKVLYTGNTIIDFIKFIIMNNNIVIKDSNIVVITLHRRENANYFASILQQINFIAEQHKELQFIFPAHPSPTIQSQLHILSSSNIDVIDPMGYNDFIRLLANCKFIITDSGGIQEEACFLGKKVIVCRNETERPEAVQYGIAKIISSYDNIGECVNKWAMIPYDKQGINPFGDGVAVQAIIGSLL